MLKGDDSVMASEEVDAHQPQIKKLKLMSVGTPIGEIEPEGQFICDQCDKAFSKQSSLARHKYEHSGKQMQFFFFNTLKIVLSKKTTRLDSF